MFNTLMTMYCYETWLTTKLEEVINYKHLKEKLNLLNLTSTLNNMNGELISGRFLIHCLYENVLLKKKLNRMTGYILYLNRIRKILVKNLKI